MTRETKIGLLVGLAFIIVIGILLSDHLSNTNESPVASMQVAGSTLRAGLGEPSNDDVAPLLHPPQNISPRQRITTHDEMVRKPIGQGVVLVNPGNANLNLPEQIPAPPHQDQPRPETPAERLQREAIARGEEVTPIDPNEAGTAPKPPVLPMPPVVPQPTKPVVATYKAQSGDTLGMIALHAMGSNNKANREAIVAANASLKSNRNLIVAGRSYTIPGASVRATTPSPATPVTREETAPVETVADNFYVVQSGDTLWSIAVDETGSASGVATIKELNQNLLGDSDQVRPNMKLRLPAKKVATAN